MPTFFVSFVVNVSSFCLKNVSLPTLNGDSHFLRFSKHCFQTTVKTHQLFCFRQKIRKFFLISFASFYFFGIEGSSFDERGIGFENLSSFNIYNIQKQHFNNEVQVLFIRTCIVLFVFRWFFFHGKSTDNFS